MLDQLYEQKVPFLAYVCESVNVREWKGLDTVNSGFTQERLVQLLSALNLLVSSIFAECTAEIPLATCTGHQQASSLLKLPQKSGQAPSHTLDPPPDQLIINMLCVKWRMLRFGLPQPLWGVPVIQVPTISPFVSQYNPCPWGTLSKRAKQAKQHADRQTLISQEKTDPVQLQRSFLHEGWNWFLLLSGEAGINGSCSDLFRQRIRICFYLHHFRQCDFLLKVCSDSERSQKPEDWPSLKKSGIPLLDLR